MNTEFRREGSKILWKHRESVRMVREFEIWKRRVKTDAGVLHNAYLQAVKFLLVD